MKRMVKKGGVEVAIYYLDEPFYQTHTAGSKPRNDFNLILKSLHFRSFQELVNSDQPYLQVEDVVFIQYPFTPFWNQHIYEFCHQYQIRTVLFLNDIMTLHDGNYEMIPSEVSLFNQAAVLIIHNERMKEWLTTHGVTCPMVCLTVFDYLISDEVCHQIPARTFSHEVVFAGNLNPSLRKFLYEPSFKHEYQLNLYGPEVNGTFGSQQTTYYGSFPPEEIPAQLQGSFGLHWNGDRQDTCSGRVGYYSTIATSHKLSLYLVSKLPIICWEHASEADFITKENLGLTISSLDDIDFKLSRIDALQYKQMLENVMSYSINLQHGYYFKKAIREVLEVLEIHN